MKYAIIVALWAFAAACSPPCARAQQDSARTQAPADTTKREAESFARHAVYLELLGNGGGSLGSLNYDFRVWQHWSIRIGYPDGFLGMINYIVGNGSHTMEIGIGAGDVVLSGILGGRISHEYVFWTATVAYRYQPQDGGFFFKIGFTPIYRRGKSPLLPLLLGGGDFYPLGGISLGYTF